MNPCFPITSKPARLCHSGATHNPVNRRIRDLPMAIKQFIGTIYITFI